MKYLSGFKIFENLEDIHAICKKYGIKNYTINDDLSIDVNDNVNLDFKDLGKLPLKFRNVTGNFYCHYNKLTSLEGAPLSVGGSFDCSHNKLMSLEGAPKHVGAYFYCTYNPIFTIWNLFMDTSKIEVFNEYDIVREVDGKPAIVLDRLNAFLEEIGKPTVKGVGGWINI
jgi:hypothetical protein